MFYSMVLIFKRRVTSQNFLTILSVYKHIYYDQVLNAAGLPNEYNTATFIQYNSIIGVVSVCIYHMKTRRIHRTCWPHLQIL